MRVCFSVLLLVFSLAALMACSLPTSTPAPASTPTPVVTPSEVAAVIVSLPRPRIRSEVSLEQALLARRSVRDYAPTPLTLAEVSQLLWAAQGMTAGWGGRTAPSAGALYPLEVYLVAGAVQGLASGVYRYSPKGHQLAEAKKGDVRTALADAALGQECVRDGAISIVIAAVYARTTQKYGARGTTYVHMEVGHAGQNVYLQAEALGLGTVTVGAFYDDRVAKVVGLRDNEVPLYIMPVGRKR
jgi:SagB-type dehydrogenase family enzyme